MNRVALPLIALLGFAAGWNLPAGSAPAAPASTPVTGKIVHRELGNRDLAERLLTPYEIAADRLRNAPLGELLKTGRGQGDGLDFSDADLRRMVTMDPVKSMDEFLSNPGVRFDFPQKLAIAWTSRQPEEALRHLRGKQGYRADDCLAAALPYAYLSHPKLVAEILRSKSASWQKNYYYDLFEKSFRVRKPGAPPMDPSADPNASDGYWTTIRLGKDIVSCLADNHLRENAKEDLKDHKDDPEEESAGSRSSGPPPAGPTSFPQPLQDTAEESNEEQSNEPTDDSSKEQDERLAGIAADGDRKARLDAVQDLVGGDIYERKEWDDGLAKLEAAMKQLGAVPSVPPQSPESGDFLSGSKDAAWIDRQPLGLRRAWSPSFVAKWAESEPKEAVCWAQALPDEANRAESFQTGLVLWTHQDPLAASAHVEAMPAGELREAAISNAAATWNCLDPAAAKKWVEALPDSPGKQRALERLK